MHSLENQGNAALFPCPFLSRLVCTAFQDRLTDTVWACVWSPVLTKLILDVASRAVVIKLKTTWMHWARTFICDGFYSHLSFCCCCRCYLQLYFLLIFVYMSELSYVFQNFSKSVPIGKKKQLFLVTELERLQISKVTNISSPKPSKHVRL